MSVSQVKKQFVEFSAYLGRDTTGQEKLKKLKDAVNGLRTSLASADARAADAEKVSAAWAQRANTAETELAAAKIEIQRLQQLNQNLSHRVQAADAVADQPADDVEIETTNIGSEFEIKQVLKRLRTRQKFCPAPKRIRKSNNDKVYSWDRETIATGWSYDAIWTLGATMALASKFFGIAMLETQHTFRNMDLDDREDETGIMRPFLQWFTKNCIDMDETRLKTGVANLVNMKPPIVFPK